MTLAVFASLAAIHLAAAISPGPSFVVMLRVAASSGMRPGLAVALAFGIGAAIWAAAAMFGLAALFAVAPVTLKLLTYAGAAFLIYLGYMIIRHAKDPLPNPRQDLHAMGFWSAFRLGMATQMSNPKPAIFFGSVFVALLPPDRTLPESGLILLSILVVETIWYAIVAYLMSRPAARLRYSRWKTWMDSTFGALLGAFGIKLALT